MVDNEDIFNLCRDMAARLNAGTQDNMDPEGHYFATLPAFQDNGDHVPRLNQPLDTTFESLRFLLWLLHETLETGDGDAAHQHPNARSPESSPEPSFEVDPSEDAVSPNGTASDNDLRPQSVQSSSNGRSVAGHRCLRFSQSLYDHTPVHLFNIVRETTPAVVTTASGRPVAPEMKHRNGFCRFFRNIFSKKTKTKAVTEPCPGPTQRPKPGSWWSRLFRRTHRGASSETPLISSRLSVDCSE